MLNPPANEEDTTGRAISTPAKTGTEEEPNQKRAIKIRATTGVERISERGNAIKDLNEGLTAERIPIAEPKIREIKNEDKTRAKVAKKDRQKKKAVLESAKKSTMEEKTSKRDGRISGASKILAPVSHKRATSKIEEATAAKDFIFLFCVEESLVGEASAYRLRGCRKEN